MIRTLWRGVRARPGTSISTLALVLIVGTAAGLWAYARHQWEAARTAVAENRPDDARARLGVCLWVWPWDENVHHLAARAARMDGDYSEAERQLNYCLSHGKGASEAVQLEFLLLRVQTGQVDEVSEPLLNLVEDHHLESPLILATLAQAYMHHLRYNQAYACLTRWIEDDPKSAKPLHWRGWVLERLDRPKQALDDYRKALALDSGLVDVRLRVADMLLDDNNLPSALPDLEKLAREYPDRTDIGAALGYARLLQGRTEEARRLLGAAVEASPKNLRLLVQLARLEMQDDKPAAAEQWLRRVLEIDPYDPEAAFSLATCLQQQGRTDEAAKAMDRHHDNKKLVDRVNDLLKKMAEHPSSDPKELYEVGASLLRIGQDRQGVYWLEEALKRDPTHQPSHKALADFHEKAGNKSIAAAHRRRIAPAVENVARP